MEPAWNEILRAMSDLRSKSALVLFSGGQDSATCLAWALARYDHVETVGFVYGQRHIVEMDCRRRVLAHLRAHFPKWADRLGADHVLDAGVLGQISQTALTSDAEIRMAENGLPTTFVPGRNILFLTLAAALGYRRSIRHIVLGVCETDYSGYPDCRDDTVKAMQVALNLGLDARFVLRTPLMWLDKAATWGLTETLGGAALIDLIIEETHSCYRGDRSQRHDWGYGCGSCPACDLRSSGFAAYQAKAKTS